MSATTVSTTERNGKPENNHPTIEAQSNDGFVANLAEEHLSEKLVENIRYEADMYGAYQTEKSEELAAKYAGAIAKTPLSLNQAQAVIGGALGVMATLMIGVVVLGKIDGFTGDLNGPWQETANSTSTQSQQTFDFLNLVPFLIVALFVLGIMASRM
ncbi:hypothetical protein A4G99_03750 [Haladaptatus sp. R4]|uniref:hypothetical protein n=1 Tax=Haladaptatus sp. R4 TaxID=1679489 RepID=UPI0007B49E3C|nr:hypothetical protein [Haladaptatus sp. R4]KZN25594.1 hypothetical protein A4G99_03750 [Haladaptatus sp. R4]